MRRCYIILRQAFYLSNGCRYQIAYEHPIVSVFTTEQVAVNVVRRIIQHVIESSNGELHSEEGAIDSEVLFRLSAIDSLSNTTLSYSVIKKGMMV